MSDERDDEGLTLEERVGAELADVEMQLATGGRGWRRLRLLIERTLLRAELRRLRQ